MTIAPNVIFSQLFKEEYNFIRSKENGLLLLKKLSDIFPLIFKVNYCADPKILKKIGIKKLEGLNDNNIWESKIDSENRLLFKKVDNTFIFFAFLGHLCGLYDKNFNFNNFELLTIGESNSVYNNLNKQVQNIRIIDNNITIYRLSCSKETSEFIDQVYINNNELRFGNKLSDSYSCIESRFIDLIKNNKIKEYIYPAMISTVQRLNVQTCYKLFQLLSLKAKEYPFCLKLVMAMANRLDVALSNKNEILINYYTNTLYRDIDRVITRTENNYKNEFKVDVDYKSLIIKENHKFHLNKLQDIIKRCRDRVIYLDVPYQDKAEVKARGASWDYESNCWCISAKEYINKFDNWKIVEPGKLAKSMSNVKTNIEQDVLIKGLRR